MLVMSIHTKKNNSLWNRPESLLLTGYNPTKKNNSLWNRPESLLLTGEKPIQKKFTVCGTGRKAC
jgi:hypothetical protein